MISFEGDFDEGSVEVAMQWNASYQESVFSFANNINTHEGGSHLSGFRSALTGVINKYARDIGELKEKDDNLSGEDVREGLTAVISAKLAEPQFEGQTKTKLGNPGMAGFVQSIVNARLAEWLEENPQDARRVIRKAVSAAQARAAARKARDLTRRKTVLGNSTLPGKLSDCSVKDPSLAEIFIVEGDSAGGSAVDARDRNTQAILPLRGKILNVEKSRIDKVLGNTEIQALITAIGTGVRDEFDIEKARYHKIVLLTDADVDGAHIRTLALTLLFREMQPLIEAGYVYIAKPPLYRLTRGQKHRYIERDSELEEILLGDKFEKIEVTDHDGKQFKLTEARWQRFTRLLKQYQGWAAALRTAHGQGVVSFMQQARLLEAGVTNVDALRTHLAANATPNGHAYYDRAALRGSRSRSSSRRLRPRRAWRPRTACAGPSSTPTSTAALRRARGSRRTGRQTRRSTSSSASRRLRRRFVRGVARGRAGGRSEGGLVLPLQGPRRDGPGGIARDDDGSGLAHARAGHDGGRQRRGPRVLDADGRPGRAAAAVHRGERPPREQPGRIGRRGLLDGHD